MGTITAFTTFVSLVSCVAHSRYLSSFSLKASFILSVDVTFTSTTTFRQASSVSSQPHEVWLQPRSCNPASATPLVGPQVLGPNRDFILGSPQGLSVLKLLLAVNQPSLDKDVDQKDVDHDIVLGLDLRTEFFYRN